MNERAGIMQTAELAVTHLLPHFSIRFKNHNELMVSHERLHARPSPAEPSLYLIYS